MSDNSDFKVCLSYEEALKVDKPFPDVVSVFVEKTATFGFVSNLINSKYTFIPCISLKPATICSFSKVEGALTRRPQENRTNKLISDKSAKRIKNAVQLLYVCSKPKKVFSKSKGSYFSFKINFITLTLPSKQIHTDKEIHTGIFLKFIRHIRKKFTGLLYFYKVESQDNGNIHYHMNTNVFMHHDFIRKTWNTYCEELGYVSRSGIINPNSTDIKAVLKVKELATYLSSYISKKDIYKKPLKRYLRRYKKQLKEKSCCHRLPINYFKNIKRKITIKLWDCSELLKKSIPSYEMPNDSIYNELRVMEKQKEVIQTEYAKIILNPTYSNEYPNVNKLFKEQIKHLLDYDNLALNKFEID